MSATMKKSRSKTVLFLLSIILLTSLLLGANLAVINAAAWAPNTYYAVGAQVTYNGATYQCLQAHTSLVGWEPPVVPALWKPVSGGTSTPTPTRPAATPTPPPAGKVIPGKIEAESYNAMSGIQTESCSEGGLNVGWIEANDWMDYNVNVQSSGTYNAQYRVASTGTSGRFELRRGSTVLGSYTVPNTGGWQSWTTVSSNVNLTAGSQALRILATGSGWNINWMNFTQGGSATPTPPSPTSPPPVGSWPNRVFAPYVDVSQWPTFSINNCHSRTAQKYYTLAFILASGTEPAWGGSVPMSQNFYMDEINNIRSKGGDVIVSFGGANGTELALAITDVATLQAKYQSVINRYGLTWVDFDIEGWAVADRPSIDRRNKAIRGLQAANPNLTIAFCLPVMPSGLTADGLYVLQNAKSNGVRVDVVNVMAMDYGGSWDMGQAAISAVQNTRNQCTSIGISPKMGVTPMIGVNDVTIEVFYQADAREVLSFCQSNSYMRLISFWSVNRDNGSMGPLYSSSQIPQSEFEFTNIFKAYQ